MNKNIIYKTIVTISLIATIAINSLANIIPFNGITTGEISDSIPTYFVPAAYVFGIWFLIYLSLIAYTISTFYKYEDVDRKITWWFVIANIANALWMFMWHYQIVWATVILMLIILISLIYIYTQINKEEYSLIKRIPFSLYLGWISVATIANIAAFLYLINWDGFGISGQMWSTILIGVATILSILVLRFKKDITFSLVIVWALIGIMYKFLTTSDLIVGGVVVALGVLLVNILLTTYKRE